MVSPWKGRRRSSEVVEVLSKRGWTLKFLYLVFIYPFCWRFVYDVLCSIESGIKRSIMLVLIIFILLRCSLLEVRPGLHVNLFVCLTFLNRWWQRELRTWRPVCIVHWGRRASVLWYVSAGLSPHLRLSTITSNPARKLGLPGVHWGRRWTAAELSGKESHYRRYKPNTAFCIIRRITFPSFWFD